MSTGFLVDEIGDGSQTFLLVREFTGTVGSDLDGDDDHKRFPYTSSNTDSWDVLESADEDPSDSGAIISVYKNASYTERHELRRCR